MCITANQQAREGAQTAIRFLQDNAATYGIESIRIAIAGTSAGAITAVNVALSSTDDPDAAVLAGISLSGAAITSTPNTGDTLVFLMHGTEDTLVPYQWAVDTVDDAAAGVRATMTTWQGAGHVPYSDHRTEILEQTRNFLWWHMDLADAAA